MVELITSVSSYPCSCTFRLSLEEETWHCFNYEEHKTGFMWKTLTSMPSDPLQASNFILSLSTWDTLLILLSVHQCEALNLKTRKACNYKHGGMAVNFRENRDEPEYEALSAKIDSNLKNIFKHQKFKSVLQEDAVKTVASGNIIFL